MPQLRTPLRLQDRAPAPPSTAERDWRQQAACGPATAELFFDQPGETTEQRYARILAAKAVCARCPVQATCREYAITSNEPYGVWGGLAEQERQRERRRRGLHRRQHPSPVQARLAAAYAAGRPDGQAWTPATLAAAARCSRTTASVFLRTQGARA